MTKTESRDVIVLPEEEELSRREKEQAVLEENLASAEMALETAKAETLKFRRRYYQSVGHLYVQLDDLEMQIANLKLKQSPSDVNAQASARAAKQRAANSADEAGIAKAQPKPAQDFTPELKQAYRQAVKLMHPDLATSEHERQRRTALMTQINLAYARGDRKAIEKLIHEYGQDPDAIVGEDVGSRLVKVIRRIAQLQRRLTEVQHEMEIHQQTEIFQLKVTVEKAEATGNDPLGDLAQQIMKNISETKARLAELQRQKT